MVVDDDEDIREIVAAVLEAEGYPVLAASNGKKALDLLRSGARPGIILLDLRMPEMNGRSFREVQSREPSLADLPVVILSGDLDARRTAAELGTDFLLKPVDLDQLLSMARQFCAPAGLAERGGDSCDAAMAPAGGVELGAAAPVSPESDPSRAASRSRIRIEGDR